MQATNRKIQVGGKTVLQSEPFSPDPRFFTGFVGRETELQLITASWIAGDHSVPMCPLLISEPGQGKNRMVYELANKCGYPLYILQGHEEITSEDLVCSVRFSDSSNTMMDYILSPLVTAMLNGGICFIDEVGKIRPRALSLLASVCDERRYIESTLLGERFHAHQAFRLICATNTGDMNLLPEFILSRMRPRITVGYPSKEEIDHIIRKQCAGMEDEIDRLIDLFWVLWSENNGHTGQLAPRDAIYLFGLASKRASFESAGLAEVLEMGVIEQSFKLPVQQPGICIKPHHLRQAFSEMFPDHSDNTQARWM
jgi:Holliday junction resolvasome RuvABC ATP-dependent DNA helicase subunit